MRPAPDLRPGAGVPRRTPAEIAAEAASRALVLRPAERTPRHLAAVQVPWRPQRLRPRRARTLLLAALAAGLLSGALAGLIGAWLAPERPAARAPAAVSGRASTAGPGRAAPGAPAPAPAATSRPGATADPACLAAVEQADTVISLLVGDVRDQRLESSLSQYLDAARRCRGAQARGPHVGTPAAGAGQAGDPRSAGEARP